MVSITLEAEVARDDVLDIMEMAGYGITYWATAPTDAERDAAPDGTEFVIAVEEDGVREVFYLTVENIIDAFQTALDGLPTGSYVHEYLASAVRDRDSEGRIDTGHIDSDAADAIVQFAVFGEIVYG